MILDQMSKKKQSRVVNMGPRLSCDATGRLVQSTNGVAMQTSGHNVLGQRMSRQAVKVSH